jgi:hypothetical protein
MFTKNLYKTIFAFSGIFLMFVSVKAATLSLTSNQTRSASQIEDIQIFAEADKNTSLGVSLNIKFENAEVIGFTQAQTFSIGTCTDNKMFDASRVCVDVASTKAFTDKDLLGTVKVKWGAVNGDAKITVNASYFDGTGQRVDKKTVTTVSVVSGAVPTTAEGSNANTQQSFVPIYVIVIGVVILIAVVVIVLWKKKLFFFHNTAVVVTVFAIVGITAFTIISSNTISHLDVLPKTGGTLNAPQVSVICDVLALKARVTYSIGSMPNNTNYFLEFAQNANFDSPTWATEVFNSVGTMVIPDDNFENTKDGSRFDALQTDNTYYVRLIETAPGTQPSFSPVTSFKTPVECKIVPVITSVAKECSTQAPTSRLNITFTDSYINQDYYVKFALDTNFAPGEHWQTTVAANSEKKVTYPIGFVPDINRPNSVPPVLQPGTKYYIMVVRRTYTGGESKIYQVDDVNCGNVTITPTKTPVPVTSAVPTITPTVIPGSVKCGLIDVNSDKQLAIVDLVDFGHVYKKICNDTPPKIGCGGKDVIFKGVYNGMVDINDFIYFSQHYYTVVSDCTIY